MIINKDDIAIYAAVLSTVLLIVKLYEMWKDRFRLEAWLNISDPREGKNLMIINLSKTPIHIKYLELTWAKSKRGCKNGKHIHIEYDFAHDIQIGPYSNNNIEFKEENDFSLKNNNKNLYARFKIAGRSGFCVRKIH